MKMHTPDAKLTQESHKQFIFGVDIEDKGIALIVFQGTEIEIDVPFLLARGQTKEVGFTEIVSGQLGNMLSHTTTKMMGDRKHNRKTALYYKLYLGHHPRQLGRVLPNKGHHITGIVRMEGI